MNIIYNSVAFKAEKCRQIIVNNLFEDYFKADECKKLVRDEYYHWVYYSGFKVNGYMSNEVFNKAPATDDHYLSPRMVISAIMEINKSVLFDKDTFLEAFLLSRDVVRVSKNQNNLVKFVNKNKKILINELTIDKYDKFGPWWQVDSKKRVLSSSQEFPLKHKIPDWFTEYERKFLVNP